MVEEITKTGGVVDICDPFKRDWTLRNTDVGEVWRIGWRMVAHWAKGPAQAGNLLQPLAAGKVMGVLDEINGRWGRGTLRAASVPAHPEWAMRRDLMSASYTTRLDQLFMAYSR